MEIEEESARESKGSNREQTRKREAKQTGERIERHESGREVLWTYADARREILRQRKKRQYQGAKMRARNGRIETRIGIEVMEICC